MVWLGSRRRGVSLPIPGHKAEECGRALTAEAPPYAGIRRGLAVGEIEFEAQFFGVPIDGFLYIARNFYFININSGRR